MKLIVLITMIFLSDIIGVYGQSSIVPEGSVLIYTRDLGDTREWVRMTHTHTQAYAIPPHKCSTLSPNGIHIAQTSRDEDDNDLLIIRLDIEEIILREEWSNEWEPCYMAWLSDTELVIRHIDMEQQFYYDVSNGSLTPIEYQRELPQYPDTLPDWMPEIEDNFILPSPETGIYLYQRCNGQEVTPDGQLCWSSTDFVIYDVNQQAVLHILENPDSERIHGRDFYFRYPKGAGWSANGRYLAFVRYRDCIFCFFTLSIFDIQTSQYLDTDWYNAEIDRFSELQWSPQGSKLAFWVMGRLDEEVRETDNPLTLLTLVVYDATTQTFTFSDQAFDMDLGGRGVWSPDGLGFVFIDLNEQLVYFDVLTGDTSILDSGVVDIDVWRDE